MVAKKSSLQETEQIILAVLLNDSHAIIPVMAVLDDEDMFEDTAYRAIYGTILDLTRQAVVPNIYTVADKLPAIGVERLQGIAQTFNTKASKEVLYLADIVAREARYRRVQQVANEVRDMLAERPEDMEGATFLAMQMLSGTTQSKTERDPGIGEVTKRLDGEIAMLEGRNGLIGFDTGWLWMNDKTGGMCPSHVWVVSAPYKGRKTTLARNLVISACRAHASVDVFALEGDQGSTAAGLLAMLATEKLRTWGCPEEMILSETWVRRGNRTSAQRDALSDARKELDAWNLRVYDGRDRISSADKIAYKVKRDRFMFGLNVFVVDYMQLLGEGRLFERLESSTHTLQRLIIEEGTTGILLAQLNEATIWTMKDDDDSNYSPGVKGGGDPAAAADFLIRTKYDSTNPDELTVQLKLARHAQPGKMRYEINRQSGRILREVGE